MDIGYYSPTACHRKYLRLVVKPVTGDKKEEDSSASMMQHVTLFQERFEEHNLLF